MIFYLDLILLLNIIINYFILVATARFLKLQKKNWRLWIGAGIGALYTLIFFVPSLGFFHFFLMKMLLSLIIILVSFGYQHLVRFIRTLATFYFVSFLTGGGVIALQYFFNIDHDILNGIYVSKSSHPMVIFLFITGAFFAIWVYSQLTYKGMERNKAVQQYVVDVEMYILDNVYHCKGLIDTGNQLYDPITRKPVMVVDASTVDILPKEYKLAYVDGRFEVEAFNRLSEKIPTTWLSRTHLVPFRSVSKDMQFMIAIRPDKVVIYTEGKQNRTDKVLIGIDFHQLSIDQTYQAIIHPELLAG